ncbi:hypothetical protein COTS27_01265 [Spirochaetota bacterium]|nr:hypothetical protein COTS27_01265 [Spirochaetota bacterium]
MGSYVIGLTVLSGFVFLLPPIKMTYAEVVLVGGNNAWADRYYFDKLFHLGVFFIVTYHYLLLVVREDVPRVIVRMSFKHRVLGVLGLMLACGAGLEWGQSLISYREATWGDFGSNILGTALALTYFLKSRL